MIIEISNKQMDLIKSMSYKFQCDTTSILQMALSLLSTALEEKNRGNEIAVVKHNVVKKVISV